MTFRSADREWTVCTLSKFSLLHLVVSSFDQTVMPVSQVYPMSFSYGVYRVVWWVAGLVAWGAITP
jgi:hypothetical protein